ncbi:hypothetical protein lbkm_3905 [Lachnospiraceae bacterium KM106-2]|nr:hypothetical protein lbkm_3905 [Lachnospiraceae bacterium KM106-2]
MHVLQNSYLLSHLDLPTIPWQQGFLSTEFDQHMLWTVKNEPVSAEIGLIEGKIGVTAKEAKEFVKHQYDNLGEKRVVLYYPYYTATKSGTIDLNQERSVIEAVEGKIENLSKKHRVDVTMIFRDNDLEIVGNDKFLSEDETLTLIDYCRELKSRCAADLDYGKNIILYWSIVSETKVNMIPKDKTNLIFTKLKII